MAERDGPRGFRVRQESGQVLPSEFESESSCPARISARPSCGRRAAFTACSWAVSRSTLFYRSACNISLQRSYILISGSGFPRSTKHWKVRRFELCVGYAPQHHRLVVFKPRIEGALEDALWWHLFDDSRMLVRVSSRFSDATRQYQCSQGSLDHLGGLFSLPVPKMSVGTYGERLVSTRVPRELRWPSPTSRLLTDHHARRSRCVRKIPRQTPPNPRASEKRVKQS